MSDSDEEYLTAEETDVEDMTPPPSHVRVPIPGFVLWTSLDGTVWYLPSVPPENLTGCIVPKRVAIAKPQVKEVNKPGSHTAVVAADTQVTDERKSSKLISV